LRRMVTGAQTFLSALRFQRSVDALDPNQPNMKTIPMLLTGTALLAASLAGAIAGVPTPTWKHLSSRSGDLPVPNGGKQQTACVVFDIDRDGAADIVIAERTQAVTGSRPSK